jgi:flagellin-like protein
MLKISNKKGISAIVATVLIILITVAAVTIIWAAIIPLVANQLEASTVCLDATKQLSLPDAGYTCTNTTDTYFQIKRGGDDAGITDIQVIFSKDDGSSSSAMLLGDVAMHGVFLSGGTTFTEIPGVNEITTYDANTTHGADTVSLSVAPVVMIGNEQKICEVAATVRPGVCA